MHARGSRRICLSAGEQVQEENRGEPLEHGQEEDQRPDLRLRRLPEEDREQRDLAEEERPQERDRGGGVPLERGGGRAPPPRRAPGPPGATASVRLPYARSLSWSDAVLGAYEAPTNSAEDRSHHSGKASTGRSRDHPASGLIPPNPRTFTSTA